MVNLVQLYKTACPLDCWDQCAFVVGVEGGGGGKGVGGGGSRGGRVVSIEAHPGQPITGGFVCAKGRKHLERINHPDRLLYPLQKKDGGFRRISWSDAAELAAEKIAAAVETGGPTALLHFHEGGYGGLLKNIEGRFFSALGGCTLHRGSLCWGAGIAAQRYDFGEVLSHPHEDLLKAKLILIWGRNPANTQVHLLPYLKAARSAGAKVVVIDPVKTATVGIADRHVRVKPAGDGALALGMARIIIERELYDREFVGQRSSGFEQYRELCAEFDASRVAQVSGVSEEMLTGLAVAYAEAKPAAILIGIGLQRHSNGGNTVRAIDALAALTGNVGVEGGGASYANFRVTHLIDHDFLGGRDLEPRFRYYPKPQLAEALENLAEPPVKVLYVSRANPLAQVGDSNRLRQALKRVPFVVTFEHFMTDTAASSDLVLPATNFLEAEDLYFNSMSHQYLVYGEKVLEPPGECRPEYQFFGELAARLGLEGFPADVEPADLLVRAIRPLTVATGITLRQIRAEGPLLMPGAADIPWREQVFETADGKYNFFSGQAAKDGVGGLPVYREPLELGDRALKDAGYRYWFVTPHMRESIHSTHLLPEVGARSGAEAGLEAGTGTKVRLGAGLEPKAFVHPQTAKQEGLAGGELVAVLSVRGRIELKVAISDAVPPDTVMVYQGWWEESGAAVNKLTPDRLTDFGNQAAYYDCLCRIEKQYAAY